jgi:hypothetical protein
MRKVALIVPILVSALIGPAAVWSQQASDEATRRLSKSIETKPTLSPAQKVGSSDDAPRSVEPGGLTLAEIALSIGVLGFTVILVIAVAWMRVKASLSGDASFKLFGLVIVVGSSLFVMTAGWSQQQITPIVGLLGTALGFIFGKNMGSDEPRNGKQPSAPG